MIVAGIDIGSLSAEAVLIEDNEIISYSLIRTSPDSAKTGYIAMEEALKTHNKKLSWKEVRYIVATGYGRVIIPFANTNISEISCHAKGAHWLFPSTRTILDMGGQDCKAIRCDENGKLTNFVMNDKCAAGTGRFFEMIAGAMEERLEDIGRLSLQADQDVSISSICAVFAKSEAISLVRRGVEKKNILGGIHNAIADRVINLLYRICIEKDLVITGGIAKNVGMVHRINTKTKLKALIPEEPQIVGALGAALFAAEKC